MAGKNLKTHLRTSSVEMRMKILLLVRSLVYDSAMAIASYHAEYAYYAAHRERLSNSNAFTRSEYDIKHDFRIED